MTGLGLGRVKRFSGERLGENPLRSADTGST
jgi:hypothetical protein